MKPEDFVKFIFPVTPEISPDGSEVIFSVKKIDEERNSYASAIYKKKLGMDGYELFSDEKFLNLNPKYSPDGKYIAFLSSRRKKIQLFVIRISGGEAIQVTEFSTSISDFSWNHSSSGFLVLSEVNEQEIKDITVKEKKKSYVLEPEDFQAQEAKKEIKRELEKDPKVLTQAYYRIENRYFENRFKQPFFIEMPISGNKKLEEKMENQKPIHLGEYGWHYSLGDFSLDDNSVYLTRVKDPGIDLKTDLIKVNIQEKRNFSIVITHPNDILNLQLSPDGKFLLFEGIRLDSEFGTYDNHHIFLYSLENNQSNPLCITKDYFWSAINPKWLDSKNIVYLSNYNGKTTIQQINLTNLEVSILLDKDQEIASFSISKNKKILAFESAHYSDLFEIYSFNLETKELNRITNTNRSFKKDPSVAILKDVPFVRDNIHFQGWLLLPADYEQKKSIPIVVEIHGGPAAMWSPHYKTMWFEFQVLVSRGYAVYFCNPRGSDGYGIDFRRAVRQNWGDIAGYDILEGLDKVLQEYSFLDSNNIFVTGGSYGGYMTAWLITHLNRFKAAVAQRGVYDFTAFAQTTDIPLWFEMQYGFEMIDQARNPIYERDAPAFHVKNITCPLLLIHSDNDFRVPIVSAEQFFWLAKRYGKIIEFVRYPREGHELSRSGEPRHVIDRLNRIIDFFDKYKT